ncbi:MAG: hypothetical protein COA52_18375 [Hyphomicrobiales bacterium]|nr:MAG: hypothetical protein COA52_18375 [Hyphomicrobiales bacterium]
MFKIEFSPQDDEWRLDLERLERCVESDRFLKGLSKSDPGPRPEGFRTIDNLYYALDMQGLDPHALDYDVEYFYYPEILEVESGNLNFLSKFKDVVSKRKIDINIDEDITNYFFNVVQETITNLDLELNKNEYDYKVGFEPVDTELAYLAREDCLYLLEFSKTGFANTALGECMLRGMELGGLPCGWIGPSIKEGGKPQDCLVLLHSG